MSEVVEHIPELKGVDFEIFIERLDQDITQKEVDEVRKWALCTTYHFED
ncbi:hypothetical protein [Methanolobus psychrotolerans]|nr:hypothetical protein [Methanolobus psychrotolerans]